ncbi:MAG TPA: MipA/OmpV family protein [Sphingomicrobium sp.]|nr:MipA/OmpV family protein [Sphingomicrobium sp.]
MNTLKPMLALVAILLPLSQAAAKDLRVRIGAGAELRPEYPGADSSEIAFDPEFGVASGDQPFTLGAPDDSFAISLFSSGGFSAGPVLGLSPARRDSDVGAPVGDVSRAIELGGFLQYYVGESIRLRGELRHALGGHDGLTGFVGADYVARDADLYTFSIGPRVRFGGSGYMDSYFGVSPAVALLTGLPAYDPDAGIRSVGAISGFTYSLFGPIGLYGFARYDRLVGDAKDSPIVRQFGSPDQFSAGLGLSYTFNIDL